MGRSRGSLEERFWKRVDSRDSVGCWIWTGGVTPDGYGYIHASAGRRLYAHRLAYELSQGPIPDGLTIDHVCHNGSGCTEGTACPHRRCVNPAHLEAVPLPVNVRRGARRRSVRGPDERRAAARTWYESHREQELARSRAWRLAHPGYQREWQAARKRRATSEALP